jgi:hypothetical protein
MEENKKELAIDVDKLIIRVHNKIAIWNNQEVSAEEKTIMLKVLAQDIVADVITTAFSQLDGAKVKEKIVPSVQQPKSKGIFSKIFGGGK